MAIQAHFQPRPQPVNGRHLATATTGASLVAYATTISVGDTLIDVDAIVVWRVFGGSIDEAWGVPAIDALRPQVPEME